MIHEEEDKYLNIDNTYEEYVAYRGNVMLKAAKSELSILWRNSHLLMFIKM